MGKLFANTIQKSASQSLLRRSYEICNSYQLIHKEFQNIESCFLSNGYPDWFIDKQIKLFLNKRYKNTPKNKQEKTRLTFQEFFFIYPTLPKHLYN